MTLVASPHLDGRRGDPDATPEADGADASGTAVLSPPAAPPLLASPDGGATGGEGRASVGAGFIAATVAAWLVLLVLATVAVLYPLGPMFQRREQNRLLGAFRVQLQQSADAKEGLAGLLDQAKPTAPDVGDAVAVMDFGRLRIQQVAVEGVGPSQTRRGPGHVPGTAGLGQPGNAVVVARRTGWGGPFTELAKLRSGDQIVASTAQGQSLYRVRTVSHRRLSPAKLYAPSKDDRLTLVTSDRRSPFNSTDALVVEAHLVGRPFEPTPQGGRTSTGDGRHRDPTSGPALALFGLAFAGSAALAAVLYRRWRPLTAYLLTTPALVVFAILTGEAATRLLPAWT